MEIPTWVGILGSLAEARGLSHLRDGHTDAKTRADRPASQTYLPTHHIWKVGRRTRGCAAFPEGPSRRRPCLIFDPGVKLIFLDMTPFLEAGCGFESPKSIRNQGSEGLNFKIFRCAAREIGRYTAVTGEKKPPPAGGARQPTNPIGVASRYLVSPVVDQLCWTFVGPLLDLFSPTYDAAT